MSAAADPDQAPVLLHHHGPLASITLNRPRRLNAVSSDLYSGLIDALDDVAASDARAVILTGAGRAFCAGADLKAHANGRTPDEQRAYARLATEACAKIASTPQPVIAAVRGYAIGAGAELAVNCDMIVTTDTAAFSFPEAALATYVGGGITALLPRIVGLARATELLMSGRRISGEDAVSLGLAVMSVHDDGLTAAAESLANGLATKGPQSLRALKRDLRRPARDASVAAAEEEETLLRLMATSDWREGVAASAEGRAPEYVGR
jgi:enoyl-CoA hydratase/carnithine racemase